MAGKMRAYRVLSEMGPGSWAETEVPHARPHELVVRTVSAGLCRTDLELMDHGAQYSPWIGPFTLGHETAGVVVEVGPGIAGTFAEGDAILVTSNTSCGHCRHCIAGRDNFCLQQPSNYGYAADGGLAPFMRARARDVVPLGDLDPLTAAPIADAGATAYGALLDVRPFLTDNGFTLVIGSGGVGGVLVRLLTLLTGTEVIAVDHPDRLDLARAAGAHHVVAAGADAAQQIRDLTRGRGVDATIDVVGIDDTLALAAEVTSWLGAISLVGLSGGSLPFGYGSQGRGARLFSSTTCSLGELRVLVEIFTRHKLEIPHQVYAFADIEPAYDDLRAGRVAGRALIQF